MPDQPRRMNLYERSFQPLAEGRKTIEVRVGYDNMRRISAGHLILFMSGDRECLTRVKRVTEYPTIDALLDAEERTAISDAGSREELAARIREIYPPAKEALGMLAIEIERVQD